MLDFPPRIERLFALGLALAIPLTLRGAEQETDKEKASQPDWKQGPMYRTSQILGAKVVNAQDQTVGQCSDLMIERSTGRVHYAIVSTSGFLGVGDHTLAVPWAAIQVRENADAAGESYVFLDADKEKLKNAPTFNAAKWSGVASRQWTATVDAYFLSSEGEEPSGKQEKAGKSFHTYLASQIAGLTVTNKDHDEMATVQGLAIDADTGQIRYAALAFGGFLGIGDKLFAVPWQALHFYHDEDDSDDRWVVVHAEKGDLKDRPGFAADAWPAVADESWLAAADRETAQQ